jgi:hypothetical protein
MNDERVAAALTVNRSGARKKLLRRGSHFRSLSAARFDRLEQRFGE